MAISLQVASAVRVTVRGTAYLPSPALIAEGTALAAASAAEAAASATLADTSADTAVAAASALTTALSSEFIVSTASAGLTAERVLTDTTTVAWDFTTAGQAKANATAVPADGSISTAKLADGAVTTAKIANANVTLAKLAADAVPVLTKAYDSGSQTITAGGALTLAHGLGVKPKLVLAFLVCTTANGGFTVGQEFPVSTGAIDANRGVTIVQDATNLAVRFGSEVTTFVALNPTSGAIVALTNSSFSFIVRAYA